MGKRIVISSDRRKLGKTIIAERLIIELTATGLTVACVKLSHQGHGPAGISDGPGSIGTDTHRFKAAGASKVMFYSYSTVDELERALGGFSFPVDIVIYESNSIINLLNPDFHIHIRSDSGQKHSAEGLELRADITSDGPVSSEDADKIAKLVPGLMRIGDYSPITIGGKHWLNLYGKPLFGEGRMDLLKTVRETGSILQAAKKTGIQYKRAWVLLHDAEQRLGAKLLYSDRGGAGGGGTSITPLAETLLHIWEKSEEDFNSLLDRLEV
ncbi:MAG: molybdopterin-guanine dinucleotide biosynthesis protein MobB [Candidatus Aegiribacteria sp.]|nr:molybdopterin-guanine dinucleotide biosynthesis protein MobB [Candidatus Aegiribacteria sp.]